MMVCSNFWSHLVAFQKIWAHLVAFSAHYLDTPQGNSNHLIDKTFSSHQEYTIVTYLQAPIRGTTRLCKLLIFNHLTESLFLFPPFLVTIWSPKENRRAINLNLPMSSELVEVIL